MYGEDSVVMTDIRKVRADETDVCECYRNQISYRLITTVIYLDLP